MMQAPLPGTGNDGGWGGDGWYGSNERGGLGFGLGDLLPPPEGSFAFGATHQPVPGFSAGSTAKAKYPGSSN